MGSVEPIIQRGPRPEDLGHRAALDAGDACRDAGAIELATRYFERANSLRPTRYGCTQLGVCYRDLGRLAEAESALRAALELPGSNDYARTALVAVLCDLRKYDVAMPLAQKAVERGPDNSAALMVAARVLEEVAETMERSTAAPTDMSLARRQAADLRERARSLEPQESAERLRARRDRAFPVHTIMVPDPPISAPTDQVAGAVASRGDTSPAVPLVKPPPSRSPLRRFLERLFKSK